jgi:hypothetical protein
MKMPGFNAEASLYKTNVHYRLKAGLNCEDSVVVGSAQLMRLPPDGDGGLHPRVW